MTNRRDVKGIISWESIAWAQRKGQTVAVVQDAMDDQVRELPITAPLFDAIEEVAKHGYVLVRNRDRVISGIITTSDMAVQLAHLGEPFLLIGEAENYLRYIITDSGISLSDIQGAKDPDDTDREIESVDDLSLGEYIRLLQNPQLWEQVNLGVDRGLFTKHLDNVREIRNDVMHFSPDGIKPEQLDALKHFVGLLRRLVKLR